MSWRDALEPARMDRVAVLAPADRLRDVLVIMADLGVAEPERLTDPAAGPAAAALEQARRVMSAPPVSPVPRGSTPAPSSAPPVSPVPRGSPGSLPGPPPVPPGSPPAWPQAAVLRREAIDPADLAGHGLVAELAGEAELEQVTAAAVRSDRAAAVAAWSPSAAAAELADRLRPLGAAVVRLSPPAGVDPPTLLAGGRATRAFQPLVDTYVTVPYADVNPSVLAGIAYVAMFGMMFGDVGHGLLLAAAGLLLRLGRPAPLARFRWAAPFVIGAGLASMLFGFAFGEAFGPTGLVPTLWLDPLDQPTRLLAVAIAVGAGLLAASYGLGTVNRWREGGIARALLAVAGLAGSALYVGLAVAGLGWYVHEDGIMLAGAALAGCGLLLGFAGLHAESGRGVGGVAQAGVGLFDAVVRLGTNTVSFARLAAFGLTHAALGQIVWHGSTVLWHRGPALWLAAIALLVLGNAATFALEGLVSGIQALRLEYYELFSRVFTNQGRAFRPWHVPTLTTKEAP